MSTVDEGTVGGGFAGGEGPVEVPFFRGSVFPHTAGGLGSMIKCSLGEEGKGESSCAQCIGFHPKSISLLILSSLPGPALQEPTPTGSSEAINPTVTWPPPILFSATGHIIGSEKAG